MWRYKAPSGETSMYNMIKCETSRCETSKCEAPRSKPSGTESCESSMCVTFRSKYLGATRSGSKRPGEIVQVQNVWFETPRPKGPCAGSSMSMCETSWSEMSGCDISRCQMSGGKRSGSKMFWLKGRSRNVRVPKRTGIGASESKCPVAKGPCSKHRCAKHPGPKCLVAKRLNRRNTLVRLVQIRNVSGCECMNCKFFLLILPLMHTVLLLVQVKNVVANGAAYLFLVLLPWVQFCYQNACLPLVL